MSSNRPGPAPARKSWIERNWKWLIPVGCLSAVVLIIAVLGLFFTIIMGSIKSSDAFKMAMARAQADARVQQRLGTPIESGWMVSGNIEVSGATGKANLAIPIHGPRGKGKLYADGTKTAGQWSFSTLVVEDERDGSRIDLLDAERVQSP